MMKCNCDQYQNNAEKSQKEDYWLFQKDVYMGKVYKCVYCGALWVKYMSGHGWSAYYKKPSDSTFQEPSLRVECEKNEKHLDEKMTDKWKEMLKTIPKEAEKKIGKVTIPSDIMSVLKFLFKDEEKIRKWLFTCREKAMQFETPISIMQKEEGMDTVRFFLLNNYIDVMKGGNRYEPV